ncbi:MAG: HAMP domain-containing sensor histidine kinase [Candidatus Moranbacteria bacterium]|nr:HAMP domain-containing sensor histidine kinase [Candidatus Moranbacteria bacterium]
MLFVGLFVYIKNKELLSARLLFFMALFFSLWVVGDLIIWISPDSRVVMFWWSLINLFEIIVSLLTLYFSYAFLEQKDVFPKMKVFSFLLLLPFIILVSSTWNLLGFDTVSCEATQGPLIYYFYFLEGLLSLSLLIYLIKKITQSVQENRKQVILFSLGVTLFLLSYSGTNIVASLTGDWHILQYGLFGSPIFAAFLAFLIVRYQAFSMKLIGAQALVAGLILLIASQYFFIKEAINFILVGITLILALGFGAVLIRSVMQEVKRKEEMQELSKRLATANQELRRLDAAKSEFISIASHQLRTPLTAIRGYVSLVLEGAYGKVTPTLQDVLNKVYTVNNRMSQLVEDLLSISRIESGRVQYNFAPIQLEPLVAEIVDMLSLMAKEKKLFLKIKLPKKSLPKLSLDVNKIREVISNLIDNAIKYTKEGGVLVSVEAVERCAIVKVKDTGIGVDMKSSERLFQKFTRSSETMKLDVSGTGLGLYVGKTFVEAHGGLLSVESEGPGKGACFIIKFPLEAPAVLPKEKAS